MPTYQYRCTECAAELEAFQKFTDPALTECPDCTGALRKVYSAVGVVFKGSGFYATDNRTKGKANAATSGGATSAGSSGGTSSAPSSTGGGSGSGSGPWCSSAAVARSGSGSGGSASSSAPQPATSGSSSSS